MTRLTDRQRVKLTNMHALRRSAIVLQIKQGKSFSAAEKATQSVFDTVGWYEVHSRLSRARGIIRKFARIVPAGSRRFREPLFATELRRLAAEMATEVRRLRTVIVKVGPQDHTALESPVYPKSVRKPTIKPSMILGQCRAALKFIAKCRRDAPFVEKCGGAPMTAIEYAKIECDIRELLIWTKRLGSF